MLRGIVISVALVALVWLSAFLLFAVAGLAGTRSSGPPSLAAVERFRALFASMLIALTAFSVTLVFGGIFQWRHTARVSVVSLVVAGLSWLGLVFGPSQ